MDLMNDSFTLASEILRKNRFLESELYCNIAMENGTVISDQDSIYELAETPYYFQRLG